MRVANINTNLSFKRVTYTAAVNALNKAETETEKEEVKKLIIKGQQATHYDVDYWRDEYYISRNDNQRCTIDVRKSELKTKSLKEAVTNSIKLQKEHNEQLLKYATGKCNYFWFLEKFTSNYPTYEAPNNNIRATYHD